MSVYPKREGELSYTQCIGQRRQSGFKTWAVSPGLKTRGAGLKSSTKGGSTGFRVSSSEIFI